jgi:hypothetical protein
MDSMCFATFLKQNWYSFNMFYLEQMGIGKYVRFKGESEWTSIAV